MGHHSNNAVEEESLLQLKKKERCYFYIPKRYIMVLMCTLGLIYCSISKSVLGIAIVAMRSNKTANTLNVTCADFDWDLHLQGLLLSLSWYGGIVSQLVFGYLCGKYGGKVFYGRGLFIVAILLLLTPVVARWNIYAFMILRIIQGVAEGVVYPCTMELLSNWIPSSEYTKLSSVVFSGPYFGNVLVYNIGGLLAASLGRWPSIFYFFGGCGVLWFILWVILITDTPVDNPWICDKELMYIITNNNKTKTKQTKVPWCSILTSMPVWAITVAFACENWNAFLWSAELPTYMDNVFHTHIKTIGFLTSVPFLLNAVCAIFGGMCATAIQNKIGMSTQALRKTFSCGAFIVQAITIVAAAYAPTANTFLICMTIHLGSGGMGVAGAGVNLLDLSPEYAGMIIGLNNSLGTIPGAFSAVLTGYIVNQGGVDQWKIVFYLSAGLNVLGAVFYGIFASGEKQKWSEVVETKSWTS